MSRPTFLSADWNHLCFLNYEIDPKILIPYLPYGTELDFINGKTYVSVVAFMFYKTKILGFIPAFFHSTFEEINLRFYVLRKEGNEIRRGVVFIKEVVPKPLLAWIAQKFYRENYVAMNTGNEITEGLSYKYSWGENHLKFVAEDKSLIAETQSMERWVTEHYWGYTRLNPVKTYEYEVKHPIWDLYPVKTAEIAIQAEALYGKDFVETFQRGPSSTFLAKGSGVTVHFPRSISKS